MSKLTWDYMIKYLYTKDNCKVYGRGFVVNDLYKFLDKNRDKVMKYKPKDRKDSNRCISLKWSLYKIYIAYENGHINPID
tara:strand:+ start:594 stop:833 length:240 start_codon:yes stop_codon:yes gene_type:complete